ncbi:DUF2953 domain-containing protein [uncultured Methanobrevibacter sp.]|uniref:DUF2953 domain-containing protein n=1 Tax=uncultured Methanobrevibacter sp. TaxID=253161 RepID=UPI0025CC01AA|nr:DUF2953 domain-containing protein [uncultured Methanobrevibacter sp.]
MIILIIILFIIILLLIGIKISFVYTKKESEIKGCLKILIFKKIKVYSHEFPSDDEEEEKEEEENDSKQRDIKKLFKLAKPCLKDFKVFLKSALNIIKVKKIENHLIFGLDSFADTGKYIGIIWSILAVVNTMHEKLRISAEPSFNGSQLDACGVNEVEIYPLRLIVPTIKLISKKDVRKFIRGVWDER